MAKKNFSGGLDSLLGGSSISKSNDTPKEQPKKTEQETSTNLNVGPTNFLDEDQQAKISKLAAKEGRSEEEILKEAVSFYLKFQVEL